MRLPRKHLSEDSLAKLESLLPRNSQKLWSEGTVAVPRVPLGDELKARLSEVRRCRQLRGGLESIEVLLQKESAGLARFHSDKNPAAGQQGETISRLLLISSDGSERFYRHSESLLKRFGARLIALRVEATGGVLGGLFFGPDKEVKALLVTKVDLVARVLEGVLADSESSGTSS